MKGKMKLKNRNLKRGDSRTDGKVFWSYDKKSKNGERWITPEQLKKYKGYMMKYNEENLSDYRERNILRANTWIKNNRDKFNSRRRVNRKKNIESIKQKELEYRNKNRPTINLHQAKRRSLKKQSNIFLTKPEKEIIDCFYKQAHRLEKRFGLKFHVDHIVPISRGGLHIPTNLQVIPATINISKNCHRIFRWSELNEIKK